jgi:hypothetical protein
MYSNIKNMGKWLYWCVVPNNPTHCNNSICFNIKQPISIQLSNVIYNKGCVCKEIDINCIPIKSFYDNRISLILCPLCVSVINEKINSIVIDKYEISHSYSNPIWNSQFNICEYMYKITKSCNVHRSTCDNNQFSEIIKKKFEYEFNKLKIIEKEIYGCNLSESNEEENIVSYEETEHEIELRCNRIKLLKKVLNENDYYYDEEYDNSFFDIIAIGETIKIMMFIEKSFKQYKDIKILFENEF